MGTVKATSLMGRSSLDLVDPEAIAELPAGKF